MISILGQLDADLDFTYGPYQWRNGDTTHVDASCAATLNNEMYVFGGTFVERQVNFSIRAYRANPIKNGVLYRAIFQEKITQNKFHNGFKKPQERSDC